MIKRQRLAFATFAVLCVCTCGLAAEQGDLVEAARSGDVKAVVQMIADGVDVNQTNDFHITALWQASSKGHVDIVKLLLDAGASPNIRDNVWKVSPLMVTGDREVVSLLVKHGADGAGAKLRGAARSGNVRLVEAIVRARNFDNVTLAGAKAQATLRPDQTVIEVLEKAAGESLPDPPTIDDDTLQSYVGSYFSERLEQVDVSVKDGRLSLKQGDSSTTLIARDATTFDAGAGSYSFQVNGDKVQSIKYSSVYSNRVFVRDASPTDTTETGSGTDDWRHDKEIATIDTWPQFRGRAARGLAVGQDLPDDWNVVEDKGVRWKTPIPGLANSCPTVWKDKVFVTTAVSSEGNTKLRIGLYGDVGAESDVSEHSWRLYCLSHATGKVLWEREAAKGVPPVKRHFKSSQANSTPATDGKYVVALFNSGGLYCYDMEGELQWENQLGVLDSGAFNDTDYQWGFASSPIIYGNSVIVQCDIQQDSFLAAYELTTGKQLWKVDRDEIPSWGTPTIQKTARGPLLIANATNYVRGYDARTGEELWRLGENAAITVPTPIVGHGLIYVTSGYRPIQPIYAVRLSARGDITPDTNSSTAAETGNHIAWSYDRGGPYLPTPLLYGDYFYTCGNGGILTCYEAKTGKRVYRRRCGSATARSFSASPIGADGRIYLTAEAGEVFAVKAGPNYELLSEHEVGEYCLATPAIAGGLMLLRTQAHVIAVGRGSD